MKHLALALTISCGLLLGWLYPWAWGDSFADTDQPSVPTESQVASTIHTTNLMEIEVGKLAVQKGTTPEIRRYGDRLIRDHRLADNMIKDLAKQVNFTLMQEPKSQSDEDAMNTLLQSKGQAFDHSFLKMMKQGHDQAIAALTQAEVRLPPDSRLKSLIAKLIPILQQHDNLAQNMENTL